MSNQVDFTNSVYLSCVPNWSKDLAVNAHFLFAHIIHKLIACLQLQSQHWHTRLFHMLHIVIVVADIW